LSGGVETDPEGFIRPSYNATGGASQPRGLLTPRQAAKVDALKNASADLTAMRRLAMRFRGILRSKDLQKFGVWLDDAQQSGIYALQRFARTVRRDLDASQTR